MPYIEGGRLQFRHYSVLLLKRISPVAEYNGDERP